MHLMLSAVLVTLPYTVWWLFYGTNTSAAFGCSRYSSMHCLLIWCFQLVSLFHISVKSGSVPDPASRIQAKNYKVKGWEQKKKKNNRFDFLHPKLSTRASRPVHCFFCPKCIMSWVKLFFRILNYLLILK